MNARTVIHSTFVIERRYRAAPARVFEAWAQPEIKARWFACHDDWSARAYQLDFRIGGREHLETGPATGPIHVFDAHFFEIVPEQRIIYGYDMFVGAAKLSVSLATLELAAESGGTRLRFTEQGAFLDGLQDPSEREAGTRIGLDNLEAWLRSGAGGRS